MSRLYIDRDGCQNQNPMQRQKESHLQTRPQKLLLCVWFQAQLLQKEPFHAQSAQVNLAHFGVVVLTKRYKHNHSR